MQKYQLMGYAINFLSIETEISEGFGPYEELLTQVIKELMGKMLCCT